MVLVLLLILLIFFPPSLAYANTATAYAGLCLVSENGLVRTPDL